MQYDFSCPSRASALAARTDIHGNLPALETALSKIEELGIDDVHCGGGPRGIRPVLNAVCRLLEERAIPTIYGNCDYVPSVVEDWDIEDPAGKPIDELRVIRDQIEARVQDLARNRMTRSGRCPSDRS